MAVTGFPLTAQDLRAPVQLLHWRVRNFINEHVIPLEQEVSLFHSNPETEWRVNPQLEKLKVKAKAEGLWNLFLPLDSDPQCQYGAGLTNVEYAYICEEMGRSNIAPEVFNCGPPTTGDIELLVRYGREEQKRTWLRPMLDGKMGSCFAMTEPAVASSDATNIEATIKRDGDSYIINGHKWWITGACYPLCDVCIFLGKTNPNGPRHKQHSTVLIPMDTPGVKVIRPLSLFGSQHPPRGHGEILFENVRVPIDNLLSEEGRGFEVAQARLGPARIHHCMRLIGHCRRALELMLDRVQRRQAFGKTLVDYDTIQADIAQSRIDIEQCRLLVLKAAHMMDLKGNKASTEEIAMIKVAVPNMALKVLDRAIQAHGAKGVSADIPLTAFYSWARVMRIADGPDEVHRRALARMELRDLTPTARL